VQRKNIVSALYAVVVLVVLVFAGREFNAKLKKRHWDEALSAATQAAHAYSPVALAVFTYQEDEGKLPNSLQNLVPAYLKSLPRGADLGVGRVSFTRYSDDAWRLDLHMATGEPRFLCTAVWDCEITPEEEGRRTIRIMGIPGWHILKQSAESAIRAERPQNAGGPPAAGDDGDQSAASDGRDGSGHQSGWEVDRAKCAELKKLLASRSEPLFVTPEQFFDGNGDVGSIGCNLTEHPGMTKFRNIVVGLETRPDVEAVFLQICEVETAADIWPFSDSIWLAGTISVEELKRLLAPLKPDEVGLRETFYKAPAFPVEHKGQVLFAWWD